MPNPSSIDKTSASFVDSSNPTDTKPKQTTSSTSNLDNASTAVNTGKLPTSGMNTKESDKPYETKEPHNGIHSKDSDDINSTSQKETSLQRANATSIENNSSNNPLTLSPSLNSKTTQSYSHPTTIAYTPFKEYNEFDENLYVPPHPHPLQLPNSAVAVTPNYNPHILHNNPPPPAGSPPVPPFNKSGHKLEQQKHKNFLHYPRHPSDALPPALNPFVLYSNTPPPLHPPPNALSSMPPGYPIIHGPSPVAPSSSQSSTATATPVIEQSALNTPPYSYSPGSISNVQTPSSSTKNKPHNRNESKSRQANENDSYTDKKSTTKESQLTFQEKHEKISKSNLSGTESLSQKHSNVNSQQKEQEGKEESISKSLPESDDLPSNAERPHSSHIHDHSAELSQDLPDVSQQPLMDYYLQSPPPMIVPPELSPNVPPYYHPNSQLPGPGYWVPPPNMVPMLPGYIGPHDYYAMNPEKEGSKSAAELSEIDEAMMENEVNYLGSPYQIGGKGNPLDSQRNMAMMVMMNPSSTPSQLPIILPNYPYNYGQISLLPSQQLPHQQQQQQQLLPLSYGRLSSSGPTQQYPPSLSSASSTSSTYSNSSASSNSSNASYSPSSQLTSPAIPSSKFTNFSNFPRIGAYSAYPNISSGNTGYDSYYNSNIYNYNTKRANNYQNGNYFYTLNSNNYYKKQRDLHNFSNDKKQFPQKYYCVYIGNIPFTTQWQELKDHLRDGLMASPEQKALMRKKLEVHHDDFKKEREEKNPADDNDDMVKLEASLELLSTTEDPAGYETCTEEEEKEGEKSSENQDDPSKGQEASSSLSIDENQSIDETAHSSSNSSQAVTFNSHNASFRVEIPQAYDGRPKGFALAIFDNKAAAEQIIELFDKTKFQERELTVRFDRYNAVTTSSSAMLSTPNNFNTLSMGRSNNPNINYNSNEGNRSHHHYSQSSRPTGALNYNNNPQHHHPSQIPPPPFGYGYPINNGSQNPMAPPPTVGGPPPPQFFSNPNFISQSSPSTSTFQQQQQQQPSALNNNNNLTFSSFNHYIPNNNRRHNNNNANRMNNNKYNGRYSSKLPPASSITKVSDK